MQRLLEAHDGSVAVASAGVGRGSVFIVTLPVIASPAPAAQQPAAPAAKPGPKTAKRIVLADDNADLRESLSLFLQALGHRVWDLGAGEPVAGLVAEVQPDLVILDIGLPDIDGIEVARRLAELPQRAALKVVALSGYAEQDTAPGLFDAHLLKGGSTEALVRLLV